MQTLSHPRSPAGFARVLATFAVLATTLALVAVSPAGAQEEGVAAARVSGDNRYETAANIAALDHDRSSDVFIASGEDYPDALAVSFAAGSAGVEQGPILLSRSHDLTDETRQALSELSPERVFVVGGPEAIEPAVVDELEGRGYDEVVRVHGSDRYETAAAVAFGWGSGQGDVGTLDGDRTALVASGAAFADALAAGPLAAAARLPLLLTPPNQGHPEVDRRLADLDVERIVIFGGEEAISSEVVRHYQAQGYQVERWGGDHRMHTATIVADNARNRLGFNASLTLLARGDDFPDGLSASVHAGAHRAPIVLTHNPTTLSDTTRGWLSARCPEVEAIRALGGPEAVAPATLDAATDAAEACLDGPQPHTQQSYLQSPQEAVTGSPGDEFDVMVSGFDQPESNPAPVDIALLPCEVADATNPDDTTFRDADGDGFADGVGTSSTGHARITMVHGQATDTTHVDDAAPDAEGLIPYTIHSHAEDCALNVVFHDANDNNQLDVDDQGRALEHWNYGQHAWDAGS